MRYEQLLEVGIAMFLTEVRLGCERHGCLRFERASRELTNKTSAELHQTGSRCQVEDGRADIGAKAMPCHAMPQARGSKSGRSGKECHQRGGLEINGIVCIVALDLSSNSRKPFAYLHPL